MGKSSSQTVGYKYYAGFQMVLARIVHKLVRIRVDQKVAYDGTLVGDGTIHIDKPNLFGGTGSSDPEGGVVGDIDFQVGLPTQTPNSYLTGKLGSSIPASRGVSAIIGRQLYLGNNPYMKDWDVRAQRIHIQDDGSTQWNDSISEIPQLGVGAEILTPTSTGWRYLQVLSSDSSDYSSPSTDVSSWAIGQTPFGSGVPTGATRPGMPYHGFPATPNTNWDTLSKIWIRNTFNLPVAMDFTIGVFVDDYATIWINGVLVLPRTGVGPGGGVSPGDFWHTVSVPANAVVAGENTIIVLAEDTVNTNPRYAYIAMGTDPLAEGYADMNPAHILRECLLNPEWGYGYSSSDLDDTSFTNAATTLYNESFGLSYFWDDDNTDIGQVIEKVLEHIDGVLYVDRTTLKWTLILLRADYDPSTLPVFSSDDVLTAMDSFTRPAFLELVNEVNVDYYNPSNSATATITLGNAALFLQQGVRITHQVTYDMVTNPSLASRLGLRDLTQLSNPLASGTVYMASTAATQALHRGSVCKLTFPIYGLNNSVVRVTGISFGDGTTKRIKVDFVEDIYNMPSTIITQQPGPVWTDPAAVPSAATHRLAMEIPYAYLLKSMTQSDLDNALASNPDLGYMGISAARPGLALDAAIYVDSGAGYASQATLDYCAFGTLTAALDYLTNTLTLANSEDLNEIDEGTYFQIDNEIMGFGANSSGTLTGVLRGLFDTVPAKHASGAPVFFIENYLDTDQIDYAAGESINVKLLTRTSQGQIDLSTAPVDVVTFAQRALMPYPPGNVKIGGTAYPSTVSGSFTVTWAHRNRVTQATQQVDTTMASVTPETNTRYSLALYDSTGTLIIQRDNIGPATATVVLNYTGTVTLKLWTVSDNGASLQKHSFSFTYTPPGGSPVNTITATDYVPAYNGTIIDGGGA